MSRSTESTKTALTDIQRNVCARHLDEAAFLWTQWESSLDSPVLTLGELHDVDERRLLAHLDALVLGGDGVRKELITPALASGDPELVTVAALVLLAMPPEDASALREVMDALVEGGPDLRPCLQRALQLRAEPAWVPAVQTLLQQDDPALVATALEVLAFWDADAGPALPSLLAHPAPEVTAAALRAARVAPGRVMSAPVIRALDSSHSEVRDEALITGSALGLEPAFTECRQLASHSNAHSRTAMLLLAMGGEAVNVRLLLEQLGRPGAKADALWALGFSGRREAAEACLELLDTAELDGLAAEAFRAITGLPLEGVFLRPEPEDDEDAPRPHAPALPRADSDRVRRWWQEAEHRLKPQGRYLLGQPLGGAWLLESFELVPLRRRHAMALEVALRGRGAFPIQTRASTHLQRAQLRAAVASARQWNLESPFRTLSTPWRASGARPASTPRLPVRRQEPLLSAEGLAVTSMGLVSALGEDAAGSCAAGRAALLRIQELEEAYVFDPASREETPAYGHSVPWVTRGFTGLGRLVALGASGLRSLQRASGQDDWEKVALLVTTHGGVHARLHAEQEGATPAEAVSLQTQLQQSLIPRMLKTLGVRQAPRVQKVFLGEAGFFQALHEAAELLRQGRVEQCIVGGMDSLVEPEMVRRLDALRLLKSPSNPVGFVPGEAAAFLRVEAPGAALQRKAPIEALLASPRRQVEPFHRKSGQPALGVALASCIGATLGSARGNDSQVGLVIAGLNGDAYRAQDWGHALIRLRGEGLLEAGVPEWYPAFPFGEAGAAMGPLGVAMAARGFARAYAPPGTTLLWVGSDTGERGALCIHAPSVLHS
ncbi:TIGR02270 family protein [Corallococcus sp. CA047B]|uniref:TIGR02270 family protein n=1 Tax=Corallococcus sp. CA047B TaxID=2316729 RepID=UPI000EA15779|nr:TIGR02270 family protein [Corallococcus sp. CA047B]RKH17804.1 TIGR02270 family protein [Corallococcus sp. CA047B]